MAAINALVTRDFVTGQLVKRKNWAAREPGVMVVFCIVGVGMLHPAISMAKTKIIKGPAMLTASLVVAIGLIILWIYKILQKRKAAKSEF